MRAFLSLGLLVLFLAPLASVQGGAYNFAFAGAGVGAYGHDSASGHEVCPYSPVTVAKEPVGPILSLRAGGPPDPQTLPVSSAEDYAYMCTLGVTVTFDNFTGTPEQGYRAYRVTDYGELAGVTTELLTITPLDQSTVRVEYGASTVGGPAPSSWWVHAVLLKAAYV
ncbi:MAG: hypothetical protein LC624_12185 [Halobacteriales archaeon]|nr:hypothetical protein [Halobacteriales archaeon]